MVYRTKSLSGSVSRLLITALPVLAFGMAVPVEAAEQWTPVAMVLVAHRVNHDPKDLWNDKDVLDADIWFGQYQSERPHGVVNVSYLVDGACGSPSACPVKVTFVPDGGTPQVLADGSDQLCSAKDIEIRTDLKFLKGCGTSVKLALIKGP